MVRPALLADLRGIVGADGVIDRPEALLVYECDGYTLERAAPEVVVLPRTPAEVAAVLRLLAAERIPFVPRGAGTGLSGGTLPVEAPVMVGTSRLTAIEAIDVANRRIVVQAGVVNQWVTNAVRAHGLCYAPDPSSQPACTIGGNIAENSGGPHTLKYGVTTNHVLGVELVLASGEVVTLGGAVEDRPGYDLVGLVVGAEGTFGIVTRATLRLVRAPEAYRTLLAVFESVEAASEAVSGIIAAGIVPAALEMMDRLILQALEQAYHIGLPTDAGAVLLIELDGPAVGLDPQAERVAAVCRQNRVREVRVARDEAERAALWKCRKRAFGAVGRLAPNYCTQDGVVPRTRVPDILRHIAAAAERHRLRIANVFHAGDGNIHPILLFDERDRDEVRRVRAAARAGASLVAQGLGAHLSVGAPPARLDVVLGLDRLARVIDHQAGDMTVTVEAGCTLAALAKTLATSGQWLPLDPPWPDATTIGGLIAANLSGPLPASQGRVRDLLLGIRVVGADGALVSGGGRVVKNVAGYDLPKLHVGALGTLGVIVEATFKVRPRPACEEAVVIAARSVEAAAETALGVMASEAAPLWLEVGGPGALPEGPGDGAAVVVGLAGIAEEVAHARARTLELAKARGLRAITVADGAALRARLAGFALEPAAAVLRAGMLPTEFGEFIARVSRCGAALRCLAHAAR